MEMATIQTQSINNLNKRIEELTNCLQQNQESKVINLENWQSRVHQQKTTTEIAKERDVFNSSSNQCNGEFNAPIEEFILCDTSQQSIECESTYEVQHESADQFPCQTASIRRKNNVLCFEQYDQEAGRTPLGLIDETVSNNYIARKNVEQINVE